jgi:hypothetical protein
MKLPQLSLRDLFWLVTLAAMGCGWWMDRWRLSSDREICRSQYEAAQSTEFEQDHAAAAKGFQFQPSKKGGLEMVRNPRFPGPLRASN